MDEFVNDVVARPDFRVLNHPNRYTWAYLMSTIPEENLFTPLTEDVRYTRVYAHQDIGHALHNGQWYTYDGNGSYA